jgi:hypothetical protein
MRRLMGDVDRKTAMITQSGGAVDTGMTKKSGFFSKIFFRGTKSL